MACSAWTNSRIAAAGRSGQVWENRLVMCGLIWDPRPSRNGRSPSACWMLCADWATVIGLRAKATVIAVPSWIRSVATAATAQGRNGSYWTSDVNQAS